jgi:hypothetical protein
MTACQAATAISHDTSVCLCDTQAALNERHSIRNLHHMVTCSSQPARQVALVGGRTSCECFPSWPLCFPCPCLACCPGSACISSVLLVWCSPLIYEAAMQQENTYETATKRKPCPSCHAIVKGQVCALFQ